MDFATLIGVVLGIVLVLASIFLSGGELLAFWSLPSLLVVAGGCVAATLMSFPLRNVLGMTSVMRKALFHRVDSVSATIGQLVALAEVARREGLLALEERMAEIDNRFVVLGIQMAVDGTRPEVMEDILRTEVDAVATRHRDGKALLDTMGRYAPAFGMIGTLLGLIIMLGDMNDPSKIGSGMAVALLTTLYGALASNLCFLPMADKLSFINRQELLLMEIVVRGVLAIQSGENPRIIQQKLHTFVPASHRTVMAKAA